MKRFTGFLCIYLTLTLTAPGYAHDFNVDAMDKYSEIKLAIEKLNRIQFTNCSLGEDAQLTLFIQPNGKTILTALERTIPVKVILREEIANDEFEKKPSFRCNLSSGDKKTNKTAATSIEALASQLKTFWVEKGCKARIESRLVELFEMTCNESGIAFSVHSIFVDSKYEIGMGPARFVSTHSPFYDEVNCN